MPVFRGVVLPSLSFGTLHRVAQALRWSHRIPLLHRMSVARERSRWLVLSALGLARLLRLDAAIR